MDWFSRFLSELMLLSKEMLALELVVGLGFFALGIWSVRVAVQKREEEELIAVHAAKTAISADGAKPDLSQYDKVRAKFGDDPVEVDADLGVVYTHCPGPVDDLCLIEGLTSKLRKRLNSMGVYRMNQISSWNEHNVVTFGGLLGIGSQIKEENWVGRAKRLSLEAERRREKHGKLIRDLFAGECVAVNPGLGIIYLSCPEQADDLKQIRGVNAPREKKLQRLGIYRFKQIANWTTKNAEEVDEVLGLKEGSAADLRADAKKLAAKALKDGQKAATAFYSKAAKEHFASDPVKVDDLLGVLFDEAPDKVDDLTKIKGIAKNLRKRLNEIGIYRFQQIALWDRFAIKAVCERLNTFQERVYRDRWIEQAKDLARS